MRMEVIEGSRVIPKAEQRAVLLAMTERFRQRQEISRLQRRADRLIGAPDRVSVAKAMLAVEERLVGAFWTIARQPLGMVNPAGNGRNGLEYFHDREDVHARYADAAGGKWESVAPRPSLPSSKDIDAANAALDWLLLIEDEKLRRLLVIGATSKRGDAGRRISWERLRPSLPEYSGFTIRTIQRRYQEALRIIVSELTIARMSPLSHTGA